MGYLEIVLTGFGLAMDAFAVSVCKGVKMTKLKFKNIFIIALFFAGFQMLMPLIGYLIGSQFIEYIQSFSHWIAFALLAFIGIKMCIESFKKEEDDCENSDKLDYKELFLLAIATSIDALAAGFILSDPAKPTNIPIAIGIIGAITLLLCSLGVVIGNRFGSRFKSKAEFAGGAVLFLVGLKLLIEGLIK